MTERYELPEELRLTRNLVRDFNKNEILPLEREIPHDSITIPEHDFLRLSQKTKEMGLWCLGVPEKHGGAGLSLFASRSHPPSTSPNTFLLGTRKSSKNNWPG